ncbi:MAG: anthranilate synthase component I [Rhodothermales bacterium]|nr:anthranilate synthase component I [Rhodothermales bacterium]
MTALPSPESLAENARARGLTRFAVPVVRRLSADLLTPVSAFLALREGAVAPFLLESVEGGERMARYSFLGRNPYLTVRAFGATTEVQRAGGVFEPVDGTIFDVLERLAAERPEVPVPGLPRFTGGGVGYLGYDTVRLIEHLPDVPPDTLGLPDALWSFYQEVVAFDHVQHQLVLVAQAFCDVPEDDGRAIADAHAALDRLAADLRRPAPTPAPLVLGEAVPERFGQAAYEAAVRQVKRHIYEGDIFQAVPSRRTGFRVNGDAFQLYRALRQVNPAPYLFFLDFEDVTLCGASPEVLVRVEDGRADVLPIAGTRRRGATPEDDAALEADLLADAKERAEHLMLVDLGRNDLGRVCETGSVEVTRYAFVERYSHVMHLVSQVSGRVRSGVSPLDVFRAAFPAGTLTGAPKVRAMQILDALEPEKRGVYGGAVGYLDMRGNLDTCIAIRTLVVTGGVAYLQAGAGVVADSDPAFEFEETVAKARALRAALEVAAGDLL